MKDATISHKNAALWAQYSCLSLVMDVTDPFLDNGAHVAGKPVTQKNRLDHDVATDENEPIHTGKNSGY